MKPARAIKQWPPICAGCDSGTTSGSRQNPCLRQPGAPPKTESSARARTTGCYGVDSSCNRREPIWNGRRPAALDLGEQLKQAREQVDSLRRDIAGSKTVETGLSDQLRESELRLNGMTAEVARLQAGRLADTEIIATQKFRLRDLTDRLNETSDAMARERKLLVADLDIRELMGARALHIVDVFDVDGKGQTQHPFGRIFYTEGKSLVFYAFDLRSGGTFQAWGQHEAREESAKSLGIFYLDDEKQNRWALKFDNPKVLAEINAVFVTVEPPGGSAKPNRRKMLYAYLNATPNHP